VMERCRSGVSDIPSLLELSGKPVLRSLELPRIGKQKPTSRYQSEAARAVVTDENG
jgi:hypothetical protein